MAINLVRKPSETPNINNFDDYRMFRYATAGFNGVVAKFANECVHEVSGSNFKVKSGEIIIDGVQSIIDANGVTIVADNVTGTEYYTIFCEVNLSLIDNQKSEIKSTKSTVSYPVVEKGDDLTQTQNGVARLELYTFVANSGVISQIQKKFNIIEIGQSSTALLADNAKNAVIDNNGQYSSLKKDVNNVLKNNSEIIERKVEIYNGDIVREIDVSSYNLVDGDTIEIGLEMKNNSDDCGILLQRFKLKAYGSNRLLTQKFSMPSFNFTVGSGGIPETFYLNVTKFAVTMHSANGVATRLYMVAQQYFWDFKEETGTYVDYLPAGLSISKIIT